MNPIERVNDFLTQAQTFYLTTVDGDRPKCRPVAFYMMEDNKLYFGIGDFKDVYKQMRKNPHVEFCAAVGKQFLRYFGNAVFEADDAIAKKCWLQHLPCRRYITSRPAIALPSSTWKMQRRNSETCWACRSRIGSTECMS